MVSIDGTDISGVTIDGSDVQEITIDGSVAWTATQIIDSFEDGNISEYSGDTNDFSVVSSGEIYEGTYSLTSSTGSFDNGFFIYSNVGDGLNLYPENGDTFSAWLNFTETGIAGFRFGMQDTSNYYEAALNLNDNYVSLYKVSSGSRNLLNSAYIGTPSTYEWYECEVSWGTDDTITVTAYDSSGNALKSTSATDSSYSSESGFGWQLITSDSTCYFDYAKIK